MKPFDLEAAKRGEPVCTRDGRNVRILDYDLETEAGNRIVAAVMTDGYETAETYFLNGVMRSDGTKSCWDLMLKSIKKEGWINIFKDRNCVDPDVILTTRVFETEKQAKWAAENRDAQHIATIKIEWEE